MAKVHKTVTNLFPFKALSKQYRFCSLKSVIYFAINTTTSYMGCSSKKIYICRTRSLTSLPCKKISLTLYNSLLDLYLRISVLAGNTSYFLILSCSSSRTRKCSSSYYWFFLIYTGKICPSTPFAYSLLQTLTRSSTACYSWCLTRWFSRSLQAVSMG